MPRSIVLATTVPDYRTDGIPRSALFDDVYHSAAGGEAQAGHVFLSGNALPARWAARRTFTIVETGFGLGLNFLETWRAFDDDPARPEHLHFVSVEAHPLDAEALRRAHAARSEHATRVRDLLKVWPLPLKGFHRLHFSSPGRHAAAITLTLLFGDAAEELPQLQARADAIYLDGFAPAKNPHIWSPAVFAALAALSSRGTTLATWSVASSVRDGLAAAGFAVEKKTGFGGKRDMLTGEFRRDGTSPQPFLPRSRHAIVLGAGLAGTACAQRLAARGWDVEIIERNSAPAQEASGNPLGLAAPLLNLADGSNARFSRAAFLYALNHFSAVNDAADGAVKIASRGVLRIARDERDGQRFERLLRELQVPAAFASLADVAEGSRLAGRAVSRAGIWFPTGVTIVPGSVCLGNLASAGGHVRLHLNSTAIRLQHADGEWRVIGAGGGVIASAPVVVVASAIDCLRLDQARHLRLEAIRGQVTLLPADPHRRIAVPITGESHALTLPDGRVLIGASFQPGDGERAVRVEDHAANMQRIEAQLPGLCREIDPQSLQGRASFRTVTPDRLPAFGPLQAEAPGLYVATGLGARGMVWGPLGAELIAAQIEGEPWPVPRELAEAVDPARFATA
jgi:tRNA 5-methylaminomethyl-2-thiouridine biosynthesis bifunctional protein